MFVTLSPQAGQWSFYLLPSPLQRRPPPPPRSVCCRSRPYFRRALKILQQPPSGKTTNIKNHCSPSFFHFSYLPPLEQTPTLSSIPLFPPGLQNSCSSPSLIFPHRKPRSFLPPLIHPKPTSFKLPAFLPESPCGVHLVYPVYPITLPSTDLLMSLFHTVLCFFLLPLLSPAPFVIRSVC